MATTPREQLPLSFTDQALPIVRLCIQSIQ